MKIIKPFIILNIFLFCLKTYAQNCTFEKNEIDKFTKKVNKVTAPALVCSGLEKKEVRMKIKTIEFRAINDNGYFLDLMITYSVWSKARCLMAANHSKITFLLANGETITVPITTTESYTETPIGYIYHTKIAIPNENTLKLKKQNVTDIRIEAWQNPIDFKVENTSAIRDIFTCVD